MTQKTLFRQCLLIHTLISCVLLTACQSTPSEQAQPLTVTEVKALEARAKVLAARGFYETSIGNINYTGQRQCNNFQLQSHRGSIRHPENSINAVLDAIDNNFDVIEIDVRVTRDNVWVVHHDARTGRKTGTADNKQRKIESIRYEKEWGYLRERDQETGMLTGNVPPSFVALATAFSHARKPGQSINIEIKSRAGIDNLKMLDYLAHKYIGTGNYFFSSLEMRNLIRMRSINPDIYLAYIQSPAKASLQKLAADLKRGAGSDPIYERNKEQLESIQAFGSRRHRVTRYDNPLKLDKLKKQLKRNFGYVLDIRHYKQSATVLKRTAQRQGIPLATYSINGHNYHEKSLLAQAKQLRPDSVIIDDTVYGFCSVFELPPVKPVYTDDIDAKLIASMPIDLDLERLDNLASYARNQLYPAVGNKLKSTSTQSYTSKTPQATPTPNFDIGSRETDEDFSLETDPVIELELRKKQ